MHDDKIKMMGEPQNYKQSKRIGDPTLNDLLCCPRCGNSLDSGTTGHDFKIYYWAGCGKCGIYASSFKQDDLILQLKQRVRFPYNDETGGKDLRREEL